MENASKALIIAGAILISILIIGLGVAIYQSASGTVKKANFNSQEAMAQNSQFEGYYGDAKAASDVKALCSAVRNNNITGTTGSELKKIYLIYKAYGKEASYEDTSTISKSVKAGNTYKVEILNDKASDDISGDSDGEQAKPRESASIDKEPAYYTSGYVKIISITENNSASKRSTQTSNPSGK